MPRMEAAVIDIDRQQLAEMAAVAFQTDDRAEIPEKIWTTYALGTVFVRATWADGITALRAGRLEDLAELVHTAYRVPTVAVAYSRDMDWQAIDDLARALAALDS